MSPYLVRLSVTIPASITRVFYSVILDEYLEMWAGTADRPVHFMSEPRSGGRLRIEYSGIEGGHIVLAGTFGRVEPGKMVTCMVSEEASPDNPHCLVLTVRSEDGGSRIDLLHMALGSPYDSLQVEHLWKSAFGRLSSLLGRVAASDQFS